MDLTLLRTCLAVYRTGSLTRAARELGLSQPAVTGQLRALEAKLEQPLFLRVPQGAVPTEAAHELIRETAEPLDKLESALRRRLTPEQLSDRTVRLAGPTEIITERILPAVADLIVDGLRLQVSFGLTDDLIAGLINGLYELVIATRQPRHGAIVSTPLMDEEFVLVGSPDWAARISAPTVSGQGAEALAGVPMISYSGNLPIIRHYWLTVFGQPPTLTARVTVPDLRAVLAAVCAGAGVSVLPSYLCTDDIGSGRITILHPVELPPLNTLFLATRADARPSMSLTALRSHLLVKARLWH
jgi:DNA-binding transcriptional LysR family regulator